MVKHAIGVEGMKRFGKDVFHIGVEEVPTPVGERCHACTEVFVADESGFVIPHLGEVVTELPYHRECFMRSIVGSLGHQKRECSCFGGKGCGDPDGMTLRMAAKVAVDYYLAHQDEETVH